MFVEINFDETYKLIIFQNIYYIFVLSHAMYAQIFVYIEKIMSDYHSIVLNLVILVTYMKWKHRKCANVKTLVSTKTH